MSRLPFDFDEVSHFLVYGDYDPMNYAFTDELYDLWTNRRDEYEAQRRVKLEQLRADVEIVESDDDRQSAYTVNHSAVFRFKPTGQLFRFNWVYDSWGGNDTDPEKMVEVAAVQVLVTQYQPVSR